MIKADENKTPYFLNELLTNHLSRYIDSNKKEINENYDHEMASYERNTKMIFETQLEIQRNAEEFYSGRIGKMPIYDLSNFCVLAASLFVPEHLRDNNATQNAEMVGAGDQVPNAHLAARLSISTGSSFPCLLAVTQFDNDGSMISAHELVTEDGTGNPKLTMFGLGVVMSLNSEGFELEEDILALLDVPEGME